MHMPTCNCNCTNITVTSASTRLLLPQIVNRCHYVYPGPCSWVFVYIIAHVRAYKLLFYNYIMSLIKLALAAAAESLRPRPRALDYKLVYITNSKSKYIYTYACAHRYLHIYICNLCLLFNIFKLLGTVDVHACANICIIFCNCAYINKIFMVECTCTRLFNFTRAYVRPAPLNQQLQGGEKTTSNNNKGTVGLFRATQHNKERGRERERARGRGEETK
jgi:hypothetical protein